MASIALGESLNLDNAEQASAADERRAAQVTSALERLARASLTADSARGPLVAREIGTEGGGFTVTAQPDASKSRLLKDVERLAGAIGGQLKTGLLDRQNKSFEFATRPQAEQFIKTLELHGLVLEAPTQLQAARAPRDSAPVPARANDARADSEPGRSGAEFASVSDQDRTAALKASVERAKVHVELARTASRAGRAEHFASGGGPQEPSPREDELQRASEPTPKSRHTRDFVKELRTLDQHVQATSQSLLDNPLWVAASHVERTTKVVNPAELLEKDPQLIDARTAYERAEKHFTKVKAAKTKHENAPGYLRPLRAVQNLVLGTGDHLRSEFDRAAHALLDADKTLGQVQRERQYEWESRAATQNEALGQRRDEARGRREQLEHPFRSVLLERVLAQETLISASPVRHLLEAPPALSVEVVPERDERGFRFCQFRGEDGALYLADKVEIAARSSAQELVPGATLRVGEQEHGQPKVELLRESPSQQLHTLNVRGTLGQRDYDRGALVRLEIVDDTGKSHFCVPRGHDLQEEIPSIRNVKAGDRVALERGQLLSIPAREHGRERAR